jgi:hypothetical protein
MLKIKNIYVNSKSNFYKKKKFIFFFLKNLLKFKKLFNLFCFFNIFRFRKNIFLNFSNFLNGGILYKGSCGSFLKKKSLRKSFFGAETLFKNFKLPLKYVNLKLFFFLNIRAFFSFKGFKRVLKNYFYINSKMKNFNIIKINKLSLKAHNGIRKKKKRRK